MTNGRIGALVTVRQRDVLEAIADNRAHVAFLFAIWKGVDAALEINLAYISSMASKTLPSEKVFIRGL